MLYHEGTSEFAFNESQAGFGLESLLMRPRSLRYDRPHGGAAGREESSIEDATTAGESAMDISGPGSVGGTGPVRPTDVQGANKVSPTPPGIELPVDEVEISPAAQMLERISSDPRVREARLAEIQAQIASGTYETPEKLEAAIMRMLSEIA